MTAERIIVTNARGASSADLARKTGAWGVVPTDTDEAVLVKQTGSIAASALATSRYFPSQAAGEAGSVVDQIFSTDDGGGQIIFYKRTVGGSVEIGRFVTPASLTGSIGPDQIVDDDTDLEGIAYKLGLLAARQPLVPTVAVTFDYYADAYDDAFAAMSSRNLVGSYFLDYRSIDAVSGDYNTGITANELLNMKQEGWTIGAYLNSVLIEGEDRNMVWYYSYDRVQALDYFKDIVDGFAAKGLPVQSVAPNQRAWDNRLAQVTKNLWRRVRVVSQLVPEPLPILTPMYIDRGGTASLNEEDTPSSVNEQIDDFLAEAQPGLLHFLIHKIDAVGDGLTVETDTFIALIDRLASEQNAGNLRVVGYDDL
jgi:hypothetical protein